MKPGHPPISATENEATGGGSVIVTSAEPSAGMHGGLRWMSPAVMSHQSIAGWSPRASQMRLSPKIAPVLLNTSGSPTAVRTYSPQHY